MFKLQHQFNNIVETRNTLCETRYLSHFYAI